MRTELPGDLRAPAAARRFIDAPLRDLLGRATRPAAEDVVLVVSELVTNAVRADADTIGLSLTVDEERVEVVISDDAGGWPTLRQVDWEDPSGRGLAIVDELADRWDATELYPGKRITVTWYRGG
ncbi:ATP-binding protein [Nocardioides sp. CER19]|uniref:ATP-binding protein n=1 Tax=Nocardioides sp. CER19 TaxID=3038538 RepID=UPI00244BE1B3|nr:ATP-binding protein [Nocardioides sp. CER19]MDH2412686.1 ATP-binding protein [Nocardioides sp. CER19]